MDVSTLPRIFFTASLILGLIACERLPLEPLNEAIESEASDQELSAEEQNLARELSESALKNTALFLDPIYFLGAELHRVKSEEGTSSNERHAIARHFRYEGNLTILTYVNLSSKKVLNVESIAHVPARLSVEEFEIAKGLALSDERVRKQLGTDSDKIDIEPLVFHSSSPEDPMFGRRAVRLLFRIERDYLSAPVVVVDLTDRKVIIEE